ncbi:beta-propeller fold lactonase family protein [Pantoea sp. LMR881]|uniref:lactonase family protein n=1 Tax=Pantoea sp. LMR881 TaxID=3014336 RepID=UPI0022AF42E4|nr:beta-propeller fold lactonase family protein [Pantoea sp. LMR881]MCZ4061075.1 beta-propeller fold lactonase family protein [Pantoea sp. LMR881]
MTTYAYVGCRTSVWRGARGKGIEVFCIDKSGTWQFLQRVKSVQDNPSWLTPDPVRNLMYVLHGDGDRVAVFARDTTTGLLTLLNDQTTGPHHLHPDLDPKRRNNPVSSALTPDGSALLIANHESGNIATLPIHQNALLAPSHLAEIRGHVTEPEQIPSLSRPHEIVFAPESPFLPFPHKAAQRVMALIWFACTSGNTPRQS